MIMIMTDTDTNDSDGTDISDNAHMSIQWRYTNPDPHPQRFSEYEF